MGILITILYYAIWWVPILAFSAPIIWTIIYYVWYLDYKERREVESWERISKFFSENADKYPEAAAGFGMAKFWSSRQGYDLMCKIKEAEYYGSP